MTELKRYAVIKRPSVEGLEALHNGRRLALPSKGGDAHGYIFRTDSDRHFDREYLQSGIPDLQKKMTAPEPRLRS